MAFDLSNPMLAMGLSLLANPRNPGQSLMAGANIASSVQRNNLLQERQALAEQQRLDALAQQRQQQVARGNVLEHYQNQPNYNPAYAEAFGAQLPGVTLETLYPPGPELTGEYANLAATTNFEGQALADEVLRRDIAKRQAGANRTTVNTGTPFTPGQEALAPTYARLAEDTIARQMDAQRLLPLYREAQGFLDAVGDSTGPLTQEILPFMSALNLRGSTTLEAFDSLLTEIANDKTMQAQGVATDQDFVRAQKGSGSINQRAEALRRALTRAEQKAQRNVDEGQRLQQHIRQSDGNLFSYDWGAALDASEPGTERGGAQLTPEANDALNWLDSQ